MSARSSTGEAGQGTVELVLVLPVLVMAVLTVVQVARVAADYVAVHHSVREAARRAATDPDPGSVGEAAARATPDLQSSRIQVELGPQRSRGHQLPVTVHYRSVTDVPVVGRLVGDIELSATAVVMLE